jgi:hypothetical protein
MSKSYPDEFLAALATWQRGWREEKDERLAATKTLEDAIEKHRGVLPPAAFRAPETCFRKRFLVPNNPQNGGDLFPFVWHGAIPDGVASWTTDYNFAKSIFREDQDRPGEVAAIFASEPMGDDIVINITALWSDAGFRSATEAYTQSNGVGADVFRRIGDYQKEVVLRSDLTLDGAHAFCGRVPRLEEICEGAGITDEADVEAIWSRMVVCNIFPFDKYWIEGQAAQAALNRMLAITAQKWEERGWIEPR